MPKRLFTLFCAAALTLLAACGAPTVGDAGPSQNFFAMDTVMTISLTDGTEDDLTAAVQLVNTLAAALTRSGEHSPLSAVNRAGAGTLTAVPDDLGEAVSTALSIAKRTGGAFDFTIGSCSSLWDFTSETPVVPDPSALAEALTHVGFQKVSLDGNRISFSDNGTILDLGAIAKGYIADRLKDFLLEQGVTSATISLGGNILCVGAKPDGSAFKIGIQKPFDEPGQPLLIAEVNDWSVVTSGVYERCFEQDGVFYHHILDPSTGYPCDNGLLSVTILSPASVDGDALSTTCFSLCLDRGMALIDSLENTYAVFITDDYEIHYSAGLTDAISITEAAAQ